MKVVYRSTQSASFDEVTRGWGEDEKQALREGDPEAQEAASSWFTGEPGRGSATLEDDEIVVY